MPTELKQASEAFSFTHHSAYEPVGAGVDGIGVAGESGSSHARAIASALALLALANSKETELYSVALFLNEDSIGLRMAVASATSRSSRLKKQAPSSLSATASEASSMAAQSAMHAMLCGCRKLKSPGQAAERDVQRAWWAHAFTKARLASSAARR